MKKVTQTGRKVLDSAFVKAQARYPVATGAVIHKVMGLTSSSGHKKPGTSEEQGSYAHVKGLRAANEAAGVPAELEIERPNGVLAANVAAGIPGYGQARATPSHEG
ncbi:hypothetical protein [Corynebacterium lowii]|uniref:Uncharacterized protein n=1 Tax=Corynebacterium lowii TaxID=1544413 RepID=A0A0Q0UG49_9CORY|nr:hypothetical protein [Corynebacterium lowii]KQB87251.1 hypothetical protein Clow_00306 [Corynebacterium lowii]MDP9852162.1 hypothetical protein [Corynebacterium lowii]